MMRLVIRTLVTAAAGAATAGAVAYGVVRGARAALPPKGEEPGATVTHTIDVAGSVAGIRDGAKARAREAWGMVADGAERITGQ